MLVAFVITAEKANDPRPLLFLFKIPCLFLIITRHASDLPFIIFTRLTLLFGIRLFFFNPFQRTLTRLFSLENVIIFY
jgi:hypothetical protein